MSYTAESGDGRLYDAAQWITAEICVCPADGDRIAASANIDIELVNEKASSGDNVMRNICASAALKRSRYDDVKRFLLSITAMTCYRNQRTTAGICITPKPMMAARDSDTLTVK